MNLVREIAGAPAAPAGAGRRRAAAVGVRPRDRHPRRDEGPRAKPRSGSPTPRSCSTTDRSPPRSASLEARSRRPGGRARILGPARGPGGARRRRAPRSDPAGERVGVDLRRRAGHDVVRRARRAAAPGRADGARGDRGDERRDDRAARLAGRRPLAEGPPGRDRNGHVRPRDPARHPVDLPATRDLRAARRRPARSRSVPRRARRSSIALCGEQPVPVEA